MGSGSPRKYHGGTTRRAMGACACAALWCAEARRPDSQTKLQLFVESTRWLQLQMSRGYVCGYVYFLKPYLVFGLKGVVAPLHLKSLTLKLPLLWIVCSTISNLPQNLNLISLSLPNGLYHYVWWQRLSLRVVGRKWGWVFTIYILLHSPVEYFRTRTRCLRS